LTIRRALLASLICLIAAACSAGGAGSQNPVPAPPSGLPPPAPPPRLVREYIKHVVIVVQENRSFDNLFHGFKGADYADYGYTHDGVLLKLRPTSLAGPDVSHEWRDAVNDWDGGRMDGFDQNPLGPSRPAGAYAYQYVDPRYVKPYWTMAKQYVLADHMFPSMLGGSFTAHLDLIAGTTNLDTGLAEVDAPLAQPWGCDAPSGTKTSILYSSRQEIWGGGPFPCFKQFRTIADLLDAAKISWAYYAPAVAGKDVAGRIWSEFDSIPGVRMGSDWARDVISPPTRVLSDAAAGKLRSVSWVIPDAADSDHAGEGSDTGPSWVVSVVNAIGQSRYWNSTAIVVLWDDWGGWYDNVPPPQMDFRGLGIRVPCIIISPYAKKGYVSHTQYEFGSILKFVEEAFDLPTLGSLGYGSGYTDARAYSLSDSFDFKQKATPFKPISAPYARPYFLYKRPSLRPPDDQ
jgi:phospholipase C